MILDQKPVSLKQDSEDKKKDNIIFVAVYGTLREEGPLYGNMLNIHAEYLTKTRISGVKMFEVGWFPAITLTENPGDSIVIELYSIRESKLSSLDAVEGYPNLYSRKQIPIAKLNLTGHQAPYIYYMTEKQIKDMDAVHVPDGNWIRHVKDKMK